MYQIKLTDEQYRDLIFALCVAEGTVKTEAQSFKDLGLFKMAEDHDEEYHRYKEIQAYLAHNREVI